MKDVEVRFYEVDGFNVTLSEAVSQCLENETYGLIKIKGVKVLIDPYEYRLYGSYARNMTVGHIERIVEQKLYAKYAKTILTKDSVTQKEIEDVFKGKGQYCPVIAMSKHNVIEGNVFSGFVDHIIGGMHAASEYDEKYRLQEFNGQLVLTGPHISVSDVIEAFNDGEKIQALERYLKEQKKQTEKR